MSLHHVKRLNGWAEEDWSYCEVRHWERENVEGLDKGLFVQSIEWRMVFIQPISAGWNKSFPSLAACVLAGEAKEWSC